MPQNFIACDRGQTMLMPPDLTDWVPDDHVVWSILGAVEQMDLTAFYGAYRENGQGRAAYEPSMMVALLLHAYARGNRSSRGIERACREDVTYKLITAMRVPDHSTIAEFRRRHERALGELFTEVLALCEEAGLVEVGVISIDGTKIRANASRGANRTYEKLVADILKEAEETDRWEDGLFGPDRGDEVPEHLRTEEGRRAAFKAARERLAQKAGRGEEPQVARIEPDPEQFGATRGWGRRTWHREAHKELLRRREQDAKPIARGRARAAARGVAPPRGEPAGRDPGQRGLRAMAGGATRGARAWPEARDAAEAVHAVAGARRGDEQDRSGLADDAYPGSADRAGIQRAGRGHPRSDHRRRGRRGRESRLRSSRTGRSCCAARARGCGRDTAPGDRSGRCGLLAHAADGEHRQRRNSGAGPARCRATRGHPAGMGQRSLRVQRRVLASEAGHELYKHRKATVEPVFAQNKFNRGFRRFQRRGRAAARSEWRFQAATHNLLKLHTHWISPAIA